MWVIEAYDKRDGCRKVVTNIDMGLQSPMVYPTREKAEEEMRFFIGPPGENIRFADARVIEQ